MRSRRRCRCSATWSDNACKWAQARVSVEVTPERAQGAPPKSNLRIVVDDDGPGLTPAERAQVARRGQKLDESKPGSGLGLSIVLELAALYGGGLTLSNAPIGGAAGGAGAAGGVRGNSGSILQPSVGGVGLARIRRLVARTLAREEPSSADQPMSRRNALSI
jgi:signal transduction histidine kinase